MKLEGSALEEDSIYIYTNLRRSRDCGVGVCVCGVDSEVCVNATLHLLILGKCYAVHVNTSSL